MAEAKKIVGRCDLADVQAVMNECNKLEFLAADRQLNHLYRMSLVHRDPVERSRLRSSHRSWLERREQECRAEDPVADGGSMQPTEFYSCMTGQTLRRIEEMRRQRRRP